MSGKTNRGVLDDLKRAISLHQAGQLAQAEALYRSVLKAQPRNFDAAFLLGLSLAQRREFEPAREFFAKAVRIKPESVEGHYNLGLAQHSSGLLAEALESYNRTIKLQPHHAVALHNAGAVLHAMKRHEEAVVCFERALQIKPDYADAHYNRGIALQELERHVEALESFDQAIAIRPPDAEMLYSRAAVLNKLKRFEEALDGCNRVLAFNPNILEACYNRANALAGLKRFEEAVEAYKRAIQIKPDHADSHISLGRVLADLKRFDAALQSYDRALLFKPDFAEVYDNRGYIFGQLNRFEEALENFERSIQIKPESANAHFGRASALAGLRRFEEALVAYARAIQIKPDHADSHINLGRVLVDLKRFDAALQSYDRGLLFKPGSAEVYDTRGYIFCLFSRFEEAVDSFDRSIQINPERATAHFGQADALRQLDRLEEAIKSYDRAIELDPNLEFAYGPRQFTRMKTCSWSSYSKEVDDLLKKAAQGEQVSTPFALFSLSDDAAVLLTAAKTFADSKFPPSYALPALAKYPRHEKIRVGYFSANFHTHPVAVLSSDLFENHDRSRFEVTAFSFGPDTGDEMRKRLELAFDKFIDVREQSDQAVAMSARNLEIDIAVDLMGMTQDHRTSIFAMRAAPVQVNYLGYPGTMGADYIDYLIADPVLIPPDQREHYVEKIAYLPHSYMPSDPRRAISDREFTRSELGLPDTGFVFCCFNNSYKLNPAVFDRCMEILQGVEGSVLWLSEDNVSAVVNLKKEASNRGVDPKRLIFASRMPSPADHLARLRVADLFLDTLPYNAHATANDALWAGLPVLTLQGQAFPGRVAASLLNASGLPELVTVTAEAYVSLAIELATDPGRLQAIRRKLASDRLTTPLFDGSLTRHIEGIYAAIYERHMQDLPPIHIDRDV